MGVFDRHLVEIREYLDTKRDRITTIVHDYKVDWPSGNSQNVVLSQDTALELGSPREESVSFLIWVEDQSKLSDGSISIVGPDLPQCVEKILPFGKIAVVSGSGFDQDNSYDRYRELEGIRYEVDLKGYMLRAASQYQREWSRLSHEAVSSGFSFGTLGGALIDRYKEVDYIDAAEMIFVTSHREDVKELKKVSDSAYRIAGAMNKMIKEMSFDCDDCEYLDVCSEVSELKSMRDSLKRKSK